jgi:SAM-dependent methyltransferase
VLPENLARLLARPEHELVLDVGGWAAPLNRADWMIDLMPYESRGALLPQGFGPGPERFDADRWVRADICSHEPWPFADDYFDFAVCTFTLEDVRDPVRVCQEMSRVARAGYIEVPSLLDELSWRNPEASGGRWAGHSHHRWLCTLAGGELTFLHKAHSLHTRRSVVVPPRWARRLGLHERVLAHFWEGEIPARERPAIDDYPMDELERAVRERFRPSGRELAAMAVADRLQASARYRIDRAGARARAALDSRRAARSAHRTGER